MTPTTYVRRIDDRLVEAIQYTGGNVADVLALIGGAYRAAETSDRLTLTRQHPQERVEVAHGHWLIRDGERLYAVPPYVFRGHCREVPTE